MVIRDSAPMHPDYCMTCDRNVVPSDRVGCKYCGEAARAKLAEIPPGTTAQHTIPVDAAALANHPRAEVSFATDQEPMAIYRFDDGTVLKAKMVLMHVERIEGAFNADGSPMYNLAWQQAMTIVAAPEMRRKP